MGTGAGRIERKEAAASKENRAAARVERALTRERGRQAWQDGVPAPSSELERKGPGLVARLIAVPLENLKEQVKQERREKRQALQERRRLAEELAQREAAREEKRQQEEQRRAAEAEDRRRFEEARRAAEDARRAAAHEAPLPGAFRATPAAERPRFSVGQDEAFCAAKVAVAEELERTSLRPEEERKRLFKELCLLHHPDKNGGSDVSVSVFQYLQAQKGAYLADLPH